MYSKKARKLGPKLKDLKQAFHHWSKNCHPDKFLNSEHLDMATEAQNFINQAYITFCSYDETYRYISSGQPMKEFPHDCEAIKEVIAWIHDNVKIKGGEDAEQSSKVIERSQNNEAKSNGD